MKGPPNQRRFKNPRHVARYPRSFLFGERADGGRGAKRERAPRDVREAKGEELGETCRTVKSIMRNLVCKSRKKDEGEGEGWCRREERNETREKGVSPVARGQGERGSWGFARRAREGRVL